VVFHPGYKVAEFHERGDGIAPLPQYLIQPRHEDQLVNRVEG